MKKLKFSRQAAAPDTPVADTTTVTAKPKRVKKPKVKLPKILSGWKLIRASLGDFRRHWKRYTLILAVVTIPTNLSAIFNLAGSDQFAGSYLSLFSIIMNVALIWAMVQGEKTGTVSTLGEAYYDGSVALVRFILVTFALVVMLIPAALGVLLYLIGLTAQDVTGVSGPELIGVGIVALALAAPSFYLLVRYVQAPFAVVRDGLRPMAALRRSRLYSLGRFWPLAGRYVQLLAFITVLTFPAYLISALFTYLKWTSTGNFVFQCLATLIVLPIGNLFMLRVYRALEHSFNARTAEELEGIAAAEQAQATA